jgi:hypothetical protein
MPLDCWRSGVCFTYSRALQNLLYQTGLKVMSLLSSSCDTQKWQKNLITNASALAKASCLEMVLASRLLVKWCKPIRRDIGFLGRSLWRVLPHPRLPFKWCRTTGTTSKHHSLPGASSTFAGLYLGYCWHPSDILIVHHVVRLAHHSLCSKEELSGQFFDHLLADSHWHSSILFLTVKDIHSAH